MIFLLSECYKENVTDNFLSMYFQFTVLYIAILKYRFYIELCENNVEVTVNTCTCTDVFTITTTKDQSGGIYIVE